MYPSRPTRGKVPEYPRPVPTFDFDDIPVCEDTIIYDDSTDHAEREADARAKKRQKRRQEVAESYLRGGEVMILTASLKGPFEGWRNPWAKQRKSSDELEVPETTKRIARPGLPQAGCLGTKIGSDRGPAEAQIDEAIPLAGQLLRTEPLNPFGAKDRAAGVVLGEQEPSSTKRVEDWLKTSDAYSRRSRSHLDSSPTPATRPSTHEQIRPQPWSSPIQTRPSHQYAAAQTPISEVREGPPISRPGTASSAPTHESPRRAEAAILESKRRSLHSLPPSTNRSDSGDRRGRREEGMSLGHQQTHSDVICKNLSSAPRDAPLGQSHNGSRVPGEASNPKDFSKSRPLLSAETSKTSTVQNIPSAQVASALNLEPTVSNAHSTNEMLQELPSTTRSYGRQGRNTEDSAPFQADRVVKEVTKATIKQKSLGQDVATARRTDPGPLLEDTTMRELDTQEMIAAIKPLDFSTIRKPIFDFSRLRSPVTATKVKPTKVGKRTSFVVEHSASDEPQKSIKTGMKVKKVATPAHQEKELSRMALFEEAAGVVPESEAMNQNLLNESLPSMSSVFGGRKASGPKSILKSSNAISSAPAASGDTASTSMKQDAQMPSGQPGQNNLQVDLMNEGDSFDLDAAIDDLGSYLGTWDAEEEAGKMAAVK